MPRKFSKKITIDELAEKIWNTWEKDSDYKHYAEDYDDLPADFKDRITEYFLPGYNLGCLTKDVEKDLKKIEFDFENHTMLPEEAFSYRNDPLEKDMVGLNTMENGLSFLGVQAGGDWENPIFFIVYDDGKKLRGYIPSKGNTHNTINKKAVGNDEEKDLAFARKHGSEDPQMQLNFNYKLIKKDIMSRIQYSG